MGRSKSLPEDFGPKVAAAFWDMFQRWPARLEDLVEGRPLWAINCRDGSGDSAAGLLCGVSLRSDAGAAARMDGSSLPDHEFAASHALNKTMREEKPVRDGTREVSEDMAVQVAAHGADRNPPWGASSVMRRARGNGAMDPKIGLRSPSLPWLQILWLGGVLELLLLLRWWWWWKL